MSDKLRKAAILISTLDQRSADALLEQMPPEQAARIRAVLIDLPDVDPAEQGRVIREFLENQRPRKATSLARENDAGVQLSLELQQKLAAPLLPAAAPASDDRPFRLLQSAPADELARLLQAEHPQVIAVVLSHIPPPTAAKLLSLLADEMQTVVLRRAADLDQADPEILHELEKQLHLAWQQAGAAQSARAGISTVRAILQAAGDSQRVKLLERLQQSDQRLAGRLQETLQHPSTNLGLGASRASDVRTSVPVEPTMLAWPDVHSEQLPRDSLMATMSYQAQGEKQVMFDSAADMTAQQHDDASPGQYADRAAAEPLTFQDVMNLSQLDLAAVLQAADPKVALLALAGAPDVLVQRLLQQLRAREARKLRQRMSRLGPLLLRDVERAQTQLGELATYLLEQGLIAEPLRRGFAIAA